MRSGCLLAVVLILASLAGIALIAVRPSVVIGLSDEPLAKSLADETDRSDGRCREQGDGDFRCVTFEESSAGGGRRGYDVGEDGFGCWAAKPRGGSGKPEKGCLTILDYVIN